MFFSSICKFERADLCYSKDVKLPVSLQRAMAAEAEAAREAKAKVARALIIESRIAVRT